MTGLQTLEIKNVLLERVALPEENEPFQVGYNDSFSSISANTKGILTITTLLAGDGGWRGVGESLNF